MYKSASRFQQRRVTADAPRPTGGFIEGGTPVDGDYIISADNMSAADCASERRQMQMELARAQNEMAAAKSSGDTAQATMLGYRVAGLCARMGLIKRRLHVLSQADEHQAFAAATREIVGEATFQEIIARKDALRAAARLQEQSA